MMDSAELNVVGHEPLTEEDLKLLAKLKKKERVHISDPAEIKRND